MLQSVLEGTWEVSGVPEAVQRPSVAPRGRRVHDTECGALLDLRDLSRSQF